jgi:DNA-binding transcriptional ArsR family regulator
MRAFAALADPTRARIVDALAARERTVNEIVGLFPISQPSISRHLRILREAGLVRVEASGRLRRYRLDPRPLREIDAWLARYRALWSERLDALEAHMDREEES